MSNLANNKLCTGCLACKDVCAKNAIRIVLKNGLTHVEVDESACVDCKLCENTCPIITPVRKNQVEDMRVYGGWAKDSVLRHNGASGGGFAGIAVSFINQHKREVAVYGATLENNSVHHERITTIEQIPVLMNSKYIQSMTDGIYKKVCEDLKHGFWVLFSGTPCQIAALYGYLGKKRDDEKLLTVEVVCHGIPGKEALDIHLAHFNSQKIYSFRSKEEGQGWLKSQCTTIERDGKAYRFKRQDDVFYKIFAGWILDRRSCSNCQYSSLNRVADITIADFWGGGRDFRNYCEGVNVIVANNAKGDTFVQNADGLECYGSTLAKAIGGNPNFYNGYKYIQYHPLVIWPNFFRKVLPRKIWLAIVENNMPWKLFWVPYKLLTMQKSMSIKKKIDKRYSTILYEWLSGGGGILTIKELREQKRLDIVTEE